MATSSRDLITALSRSDAQNTTNDGSYGVLTFGNAKIEKQSGMTREPLLLGEAP